ncbi:DUF916 domain-containing protein [Lactococcus ileimucosae]|uniref:DUF916 domain-containing protein n=1 Tax=Lactococcus ileimucosae TaxID=2941329 RepID=UPI0035148390
MKKKIALCSLLFLTSFLGLMLKGENIAAQENAGADFSARPLLEKHQIDDKLGYWWLNVKSGEEITLYIQINNGKQKNTFDITSNQAITNSNFIIDYGLKEDEAKKFLSHTKVFDFYKNISIGENKDSGSATVVLQPGESKKIPLKVRIPNSWTNKIAIGGINVTRRANEVEKEQSLLNIYSSAVALILQSGERDKSASLSLSPDEIKTDEQSIRLKNNKGVLQEKTQLKVSIKDKKGNLYSSLDYPSGTVVPYADITLPLQVKKALNKGGEYKLDIEARQGNETLKEAYILRVDSESKVQVSPQGAKQNAQTNFLGLGALVLAGGMTGFIGYSLKQRKEKK